jgi:REP element-mobilizing transposase RayT
VPRPLRLQLAGGVFHITARGNRRQPIFHDDGDRQLFLHLLAQVLRRCRWTCHAYCLMPNHYHLLVETHEETLSAGLQRLNGGYAQLFNARHGFDGHLFQGRFYSKLVESNQHLIELSRYIVLNPVRAGLCATAGEWRWSSYRAATGASPTPDHLDPTWLVAQFGHDPTRQRANYASFVGDAPARPARPP